MDPLTAVQVAGTILTFVDFGLKLLSSTSELYHSVNGSLAVNEELDMVVTQLSSVTRKISHSEDLGPDLEKTCDKANTLAIELLDRLDSLKVKGKKRGWKSFQKAFEAAWTKTEISSLQERLNTLREDLDTRILVSVRGSISAMSTQNSERFDKLDRQTQQIITALLSSQPHDSTETLKSVDPQTIAVTQILGRMAIDNANQHEMTRATISTLASRARPSDGLPLSQRGTASLGLDEEEIRTLAGRHVLDSLNFRSMTNRYEQVGEAHPETFEWIFKETGDINRAHSNFVNWLSSDDGQRLYWIRGKAGSGKSTLLRFIFDDLRTTKLLEEWATKTSNPLCVASFFFWNSGTTEQKSREGFLRTLLHQVLTKQPELLPIVAPSPWATAYSMAAFGQHVSPQYWKLKDLLETFDNLVNQTEVPLQLCFLIDGLDEFGGEQEELCELVKRMSTLKNVKTCISSRPWVIFNEYFSASPGLRLQDLTRPDIKHYVQDKIENHATFQDLSNRNPTATAALIAEITDKSDGVFLWVAIVVKSLLKGFRNRDTVQDLQKRLRQFPKDLEPLYNHMFGLIEDVYEESSSKIFQIFHAFADGRTDHENIFGYFYKTASITPLMLYYAIHLQKDEDVVQMRNMPDRSVCSDEMEIQLAVRCAGLLEVNRTKANRRIDIEYIHRTASDFIRSENIWGKLLTRTNRISFSPNTAILRSLIYQTCNEVNPKVSNRLSLAVMTRACYAELETNMPNTMILDYMDQQLSQQCTHRSSNRLDWWEQTYNSSYREHELQPIRKLLQTPTSFLELAIGFDLALYVGDKIKTTSGLNSPSSRISLLYFATEMAAPSISTYSHWGFSWRTGSLLLKLGASPNEKTLAGYSSWELFLISLGFAMVAEHDNKYVSRRNFSAAVSILRAFIGSGADPQASIFMSDDIQRFFGYPRAIMTANEIIVDFLTVNTTGDISVLLQDLGYGGAKRPRKLKVIAKAVLTGPLGWKAAWSDGTKAVLRIGT